VTASERAASPDRAQAPQQAAEAPQRVLRVLQRVVFPGDDLDVVPLYVETNMERGASELASEQLTEALVDGTTVAATATATVTNSLAGESQDSIRFGNALPFRPDESVELRRSAVIKEGRRVSFGTYFNAFPASYWRRWTHIDAVTLRVRLAGEATVVLYRSTAKGISHPVETISVTAGEPETIERTLPLKPFIDGGWYWFDIVAGGTETTLIEAEWLGLAEPAPPGRVSIGITTVNRPDFLLALLRTLGDATPLVTERLDAVYVIDQGTQLVTEQPDFADATKKLGDKLHVIVQGNLGGSGGFSRSMDETVRAGQSDYVLLLDDDITLDPECILRAVTFADLTRKPTIVGGHMFSLYDRSVLHAFGESVFPVKWWWGAAINTKTRHDFGLRNLRHTPWLHRRVDVDYNGWWMCLIPTKIVRELGLALPVFIKWDDAEYGLRARDAGYPTVSMPGVAAWHVTWQDKSDSVDWQAYYHIRNRLVAALLHSPFDHGGRLVAESGEIQVLHLLSMHYSAAELRLQAIEDVLSGPDHLHRDLPTRLGELQEIRRGFSDAQSVPDLEAFPPPRRRKPPANLEPPTNKVNLFTMAGAAALRQLRTVSKQEQGRPEAALPYQDSGWWVVSTLDSAVVSSPDGTSAAWFKRDPKLYRSLGRRSLLLHARLAREWPRLRAQYRAAAPEFNSPERWRKTFELSARDPHGQS
jgi:galactofuranosylgalactofuranosylrhamnosyl-N-acetylglucosaminyl-diphospho-decaprenol beta-1,5/1,6-galactofuranosyltransferase